MEIQQENAAIEALRALYDALGHSTQPFHWDRDARIAGNIAGTLVQMGQGIDPPWVAKHAVALARAIVDEVQRTEPRDPQEGTRP